MKNTLLLMAMLSLLTAQEKPVCKEIVTNKFGNYIVKRQEFLKYNECIVNSDEMITNNETNQTIKLDGIVRGLEFISLDDRDMLKVNYHAGVHTNVVAFFFIAENGDLSAVEGGSMASDIGDPAIYLDSLNNSAIVIGRYTKYGKECRYMQEDIYEYKNNKFLKVGENTLYPEGCEEEK